MPTLGIVGIADKGVYSATATYMRGNFVYYEGSTWVTLKDNLTGVTPQEGANWKYLARGFLTEQLADVMAKDTSGLLGTVGAQVSAQAIMDEAARIIATEVMKKTDLTNQIINDATKAASAAALYSVKQELDTTNSNLGKIHVEIMVTALTSDSKYVSDGRAYIDIKKSPYQNPQDIPLIATLHAGVTDDYYIVKAVFSEYGSIVCTFNKTLPAGTAVSIGIAYKSY